jgi:hypothetical protein
MHGVKQDETEFVRRRQSYSTVSNILSIYFQLTGDMGFPKE